MTEPATNRDENLELFQTKRATVPEMESLLYHPFPVLDHGFIRIIDYMGNDAAIVQAARVSYGKGTKQTSEDKGLINYLMRHRHTTPFEMCEIKLHVKLPMFVAREWIRHRTANVNEYSARYSILANEFYIPKADQLSPQSKTNKQGRDKPLPVDEATKIQNMLAELCVDSYNKYTYFMNEEGQHTEHGGVARELARLCLPVNFYTEWYWKIDLHNLFHFIKLRADEHAQYEIRVYADILAKIVEKWVPYAHGAFRDYSQYGTSVSEKGMAVIKRMLGGEKVEQENSGLSGREWKELMERLA